MAAGDILTTIGTAIVFTDTTGDAAIDFQNLLASSGGVFSDRYDRGAGAKPVKARVWGIFQTETAPALGETILVWAVEWTGAGTYCRGGLATAKGTLSSDQARNLGPPDVVVVVDKTGAATDIVGSGEITITGRYVTVAVRNLVADNLKNTDDVSKVLIEWLTDAVQTA